MSEYTGTVLLTGANGSLGLALVKELLDSYPGYSAILTVRETAPTDKNTAALRAIVEKFPKADERIQVLPLDLGSLESVNSFCALVKSKIEAAEIPLLSAIICNAFSWGLNGQSFTPDGYETSFQVAHLSHFSLVVQLLGQMHKEPGAARVVMLGSSAHEANGMTPYPPRIPDNIKELAHQPPDKEGEEFAQGFMRYGISKLCNIMFAYDLNRRVVQDPKIGNITALAINPGTLPSSRAFDAAPMKMRFIMRFFGAILPLLKYFTQRFRTIEDSAKDLLYLALEHDAAGCRGYYVGRMVSTSSEISNDIELQMKLWTACVEWAKLSGADTALAEWQ